LNRFFCLALDQFPLSTGLSAITSANCISGSRSRDATHSGCSFPPTSTRRTVCPRGEVHRRGRGRDRSRGGLGQRRSASARSDSQRQVWRLLGRLPPTRSFRGCDSGRPKPPRVVDRTTLPKVSFDSIGGVTLESFACRTIQSDNRASAGSAASLNCSGRGIPSTPCFYGRLGRTANRYGSQGKPTFTLGISIATLSPSHQDRDATYPTTTDIRVRRTDGSSNRNTKKETRECRTKR
jgi:hypothetical protein